jgi:MoaA/NifB/PqqE/SkfB family radical SAM enzyme
MDAAIILTYRCNARCQMCDTWQYPTRVEEEFPPELLEKLPRGLGRVNLTGGEPALRKDLLRIVEVLAPKANRLEISTNGYFTDRLVEVAKQHPDLLIRISVEGLPETNDRIRGIKNGFDHALRSYLRLREVGVKDLGFAVTIQDSNKDDLLDLFHLADHLGAEFAQAVPHNSYYFHKFDNRIDEVEGVQAAITSLIEGLLKSKRPKQWARAYLNRGLVDHVAGTKRRLDCTAGTDIFFLDPSGEVYPCNGRDWSMGNLNESTFDEIWNGPKALAVRERVCSCDAGCWMTGTAVPAMRRKLPSVLWWVARNKLRVMRGLPVDLGD